MENPKCPYCGEEMKFSYGYDGYIKELGDAIGVAQTTISTWERGTRQPDHECLILLADYFNVSPFFR